MTSESTGGRTAGASLLEGRTLRPLADGIEIDAALGDEGAPYDSRAASYDRLIRSRIYHRLAWSTSPDDYARFATDAIAAPGRLLDLGCGSLANLAPTYASRTDPVLFGDRSRAMLERARARLDGSGPEARFVVLDALDPPFADEAFDAVLCHGMLHVLADPAPVLDAVARLLRPGCSAWISALAAVTRRGRLYLGALERAGEVGPVRTPADWDAVLAAAPLRTAERRVVGSMLYARLERA